MKRHLERPRRVPHRSLTELNITPLLDLVFVLLVIFILTTPQLTNSLEISLPSGKPLPPKPVEPKPKIHHIVIDEQGQTRIDEQLFSDPALKQRLQQFKKDDANLKVVVEASDQTDYQHVVDVFDLLQQLEIKNVGLATESPAAAGH